MLKESNAKQIYSNFGERDKSGHKYNNGHVLVIGGNIGMPGAARLTAEAALRSGAGLVSVATRQANVDLIQSGLYEIMVHGVETCKELEKLMIKCDVIVIGPGLGLDDWAQAVWDKVKLFERPKVVDADALKLLAQDTITLDDSVITPHSGEASLLIENDIPNIDEQRIKSITKLREFSEVTVLKGRNSLISSPHEIAINRTGNAALSTAGTGDVLSGMIGGLIAQGLSLGDAAKLGVWLHGSCADLYLDDGNKERSMIASDIFTYLKKLL